MQLGSSIALFLCLAVALLVMFCLVSRLFMYKKQKELQENAEIYSEVDDMGTLEDEQAENGYRQFLEKRQLQQIKAKTKKPKQLELLTEMTNLESLNTNGDNIYLGGVSLLKRRLEGDTLSARAKSSRSEKSAYSRKSFRPERIEHHSKGKKKSKMSKQEPFDQSQEPPAITVYKFISKLILYNTQGICITTNNVKSVSKKQDQITSKASIDEQKITNEDENFQEQLEALGFSKGEYSCFKFESTVEIPHMAENKPYQISFLQVSESKEQIDFSEYFMLIDKIKNNKL